MGLLSRTERQQLIDLLLKLPGIDNQTNRHNLVAALPRQVRQLIPYGMATRDHVTAMVNTVDEEGLAQADGTWLMTLLIEEAIWAAPKGSQLHLDFIQFYDRVRLWQDVSQANTTPEAILRDGAGPYDVDEWYARFRQVCNSVCRLTTPSGYVGTAFLVAPDLILTNWHVIEHDAKDPDRIGRMIARFDFRKELHSDVITSGTAYHLRAELPVAASPFAELDFALLRIEGEPGYAKGLNGGQRGWLSPDPRRLVLHEPLMIVQHPNGLGMRIALDQVLKIDKQRIRYTTNTQSGSSGSPCLDRNWNLVALHHAGVEQEYNLGIPIGEIVDRADVRVHVAAQDQHG